MKNIISYSEDVCRAKLPWKTAIEFASYFIVHGIPAPYECYGYNEEYRTIEFEIGAPNANIMLAWIQSWEEGHEACPFCGGVGEVYNSKEPYKSHNIDTEIEYTHIRCTKCQCMTNGIAYAQDNEIVWKLWDKRARKN